MTPFRHLDAEQEGLAATLASCKPDLEPAAKGKLAEEACRVLTLIAQVREELIYPWCVGRVPPVELDLFLIEGDLIRILIAEIMVSRPTDLLYDGLVAVLQSSVRRRWSREEAPGGLWSTLAGLDVRDLDVEIGARLQDLDAKSRTADWTPLLPVCFETLRSSVPPGATRWAGP